MRSLSGLLLAAIFWGCMEMSTCGVDVLTHHNDRGRTGLNAAETVLSPGNVSVGTFGKLFSHVVDGQVYAQPLVLTGVVIPGKGTHDVVFVATQHDSVYAFDARGSGGANAEPLWHRSFIDPASGITPVPSGDTGSNDINPEVGITSTPVIDAASGTLYCVTKTKERGAYFQRLHALDVRTGAERAGSPKLIEATIDATGAGSVNGRLSFDALRQNQRCGLLLNKGVVYIAWASHGDQGAYHGWVMGYDAKNLAQVAVFNSTPDGGLGGIWEAGCGLSADEAGRIYCSVGNGSFDLDANHVHIGRNFGNAVLRLGVGASGALSVEDFFVPSDQEDRNEDDVDLGSSGVTLLPPLPGVTERLAIVSGKPFYTPTGPTSPIYVLDRANLGGFNINADAVLQKIEGQVPGLFGTMAFFNDKIYVHGSGYSGGDVLKAFDVVRGRLSPTPSAQAPANRATGFPGATPSVSANGKTGGIVWEIERASNAVLHAYDAADVSRELYNSAQAPKNRDAAGVAVKFTVPTVANGLVYVGGAGRLSVYGLLRAAAPVIRIDSPKPGARLRNPTVEVRGAASSLNGVSEVEVRIENSGGPGVYAATVGTKTWSYEAALLPGPNVIHVRASDMGTNVMHEVTRTVNLVRASTLSVSVDGKGSVTSGFVPASMREVGVTYSLNAVPAPGFAFDAWSGSVSSKSARLSFVMTENAALTARFVPSPFVNLRGTFSGLVTGGDVLGFIRFTLGSSGAFSAWAQLGGIIYTGKGVFQTDGTATFSLVHGAQSIALTVNLALDGSPGRITGTLGNSTLSADRVAGVSSAPSGRYTMSLAPDASVPASPQGFGYLRVVVGGGASLRAAGRLADGSIFSQGTFLSTSGDWRLYSALYARKGVLMGTVAVDSNGLANGELLWVKPARLSDRRFKNGFTAAPLLSGALYDAKLSPNALGIADAAGNVRLTLFSDALGAPIPVVGTLFGDNRLRFEPDATSPVLSISVSIGILHGSFLHPATGRRVAFFGALLQNLHEARGFFLEATQSGAVELGASTPQP